MQLSGITVRGKRHFPVHCVDCIKTAMACSTGMVGPKSTNSGLDFNSMQQVANLIGTLAAAGKIIFIVTHDYEFVCRTCSRVLHFDAGEMCNDLLVEPSNLVKLKELFSV